MRARPASATARSSGDAPADRAAGHAGVGEGATQGIELFVGAGQHRDLAWSMPLHEVAHGRGDDDRLGRIVGDTDEPWRPTVTAL